MFRRAIPFLFAALFVPGLLGAAPVPPAPRADDALSASALKLLSQRKVQKELKLTAEQRLAILDGMADHDEEYEKKINDLVRQPNLPNDAFEKLDKERRKANERLFADAAKGVTAAQRARLRQLDLRLRGAAAFTDPQVEKRLLLTDAQKKKAAEVAERLKDELNRFIDGNGQDNEAQRRTELFEFRKARLKEMEDALTADQKTTWTTMLGAPVTGFAVDDLWLKVEEEADMNPSDE